MRKMRNNLISEWDTEYCGQKHSIKVESSETHCTDLEGWIDKVDHSIKVESSETYCTTPDDWIGEADHPI